MPPLRVLQVSWEYPPVMYGGLGRHVHALSVALAAGGLEVAVLTQGPPGLPAGDPGDPPALRVVRAPMGPDVPDVHADTAGFVQALQARLTEAGHTLLDQWRPDVVHGHDWVVAQASEALADQARVPLVMTVHATETGLWNGWLSSDFSRWRAGIERSLAARSDRLVVCSSAMRSEVVDGLGAAPARTAVIPNGVDMAAWRTTAAEQAAARAAQRIPPREPLAVLVGRLEWEKGGQDAIAAVSLLARRGRRVHLALVGKGGQRDTLAELAAEAGVADRVHLVGRLDDRGVAALLGAADVALVPSRYEPFGMVALEAMAADTPVVVTHAGGLGDLVDDGATGLVVPPADPPALAAAVAAVLDDPARAALLAAAARRAAADRYGWDAVAAQTAAVYAGLVPSR